MPVESATPDGGYEADVMLVFHGGAPEHRRSGSKPELFHPVASMLELESFIRTMNGLYPEGWDFATVYTKLIQFERERGNEHTDWVMPTKETLAVRDGSNKYDAAAAAQSSDDAKRYDAAIAAQAALRAQKKPAPKMVILKRGPEVGDGDDSKGEGKKSS
jgi:hypothetical protein